MIYWRAPFSKFEGSKMEGFCFVKNWAKSLQMIRTYLHRHQCPLAFAPVWSLYHHLVEWRGCPVMALNLWNLNRNDDKWCVYIYIYTHWHTYMHNITLHYFTLLHITLHCITLHCIALHYIYITLHCITLHCIALHYIYIHYITYIYIHNSDENWSIETMTIDLNLYQHWW